MKAVWDGPIILLATFKILLFSIFVKILKVTFKRQIGLYCCIRIALEILGNKVIIPKFKLWIGNLTVWNLEKEAHQIRLHHFPKNW
jgi:hypothetical protein